MKMQMTTIAAAVALSAGMAAHAQTVTDPNNLDYVGAEASPPSYGVDNKNDVNDENAWSSGLPSQGAFNADSGNSFLTELSGMSGTAAAIGTNDSTINQTTQQGGAAHGNAASVVQSGGTQNDSNIAQNKQGTGDALQAEVEQIGNANRSDITQDLSFGATAKVYQTGDANLSRVTQLGADNNGAEITQTGTDHRSIVEQGTQPGGADSNSAFVTQTGTINNQSFIRQQWDSNYADVTQSGDNGVSKIWQQSDNNTATLNDSGSYNRSAIRQGAGGSSDNNEAYVTQGGSYNDSYVSQMGGDANLATIQQTGDYGLSNVFQNGTGNAATVTQSGDGDVSWILQNGAGKTATVMQSGNGIAGVEFNESYILQQGAGAHTAAITQAHAPSGGWNNVSTVTQLGATAGNATVTQTGAGNRASTLQY